MNVPVSWLREYCDPGWSPEELAERLAMTGTKVARTSRVGIPSAEGFVVGRVLSVDPHPDADRLSVCQVDAGDGSPRTIVCGAPNVAAGQTVAVAVPGARMADGSELRQAELRGVVSDGMILSEVELEIGQEAGGIAVLDDGPSPGTPLAEALPIAESVLELEVTPNRVDCLGVWGVARELHATSGAPLAAEPWEADAEPDGEGEAPGFARIEVLDPDLCPRFTARVFTDVRIGPSPLWLKARLSAAGMRPIANLVDITNYVMLLTAQPLHAFDLDRVEGAKLTVRRASDGETLTTLDGEERRFDSEAMIICDEAGPTSIAGIMGGQRSEVSDDTTRVLLEVATWDGMNILRTSNLLGLRSEASTRFEKQLHPELAMRAQRLASRLLVELCGARMVPGTIDVAAAVPEPRRLGLRMARVEKLLGERIEPASASDYLERLGCEVSAEGEQLAVTVPPERHYDLTREVDLVEEVARIHGLEKLPITLPAAPGAVGGLTREQVLRRRAEDVISDLGFDEIVSWSFTDPGLADRLRLPEEDARRQGIRIFNPLSQEHSLMRTSLLGGLLDAAGHAARHGVDRVALFESGRVYLPGPGEAGKFAGKVPPPAQEPHLLGCLASGPLASPSWAGEPAIADFFSLKGVLESLAEELLIELDFESAEEPFLHPGRTAAVLLGGGKIGWLGELHPLVLRSWDLESGAGFMVDLEALIGAAGAGRERYEDVTTYPAVHEDVAVTVDEAVPAERVRTAVLQGGGELLRSAEIFDLYRGSQVGEGRKSLALRLEFRAPDRTLTDEEVAGLREKIEESLREIGGTIRE